MSRAALIFNISMQYSSLRGAIATRQSTAVGEFTRSLWSLAMMVNIVAALFFYAALPAQAADWAAKERAAAKALYIPELKLVSPDMVSGDAAEALRRSNVALAYVETTVNPGKYTCTALSQSTLKEAANGVAASLGKLSDAAISQIGLRYVLLCGEAKAGGRMIGGIPVPPLKTLMLSMGGNDPAYQSHIFFHELFHYMEFTQNRSTNDPRWNAKFTGYGSANTAWKLGSGSAGFVSAYAQSSPEEDRAEVFAHLMSAPATLRRYADSRKDAVLNEKISYIKDMAAGRFGIDVQN